MVVCEGSGSWLEFIQFEGKVYWTIEDEKAEWLFPDDDTLREEAREYLLVSDSSYRSDLKGLREKNYDEAEKEKHDLEE